MAVLEILKYPHPVLKKRCEKVERVDDEVKRLICDMRETMYEANGIGSGGLSGGRVPHGSSSWMSAPLIRTMDSLPSSIRRSPSKKGRSIMKRDV